MAHVYSTLLTRGKFSWQQLWNGQRFGTDDLKPPWPAKVRAYSCLQRPTAAYSGLQLPTAAYSCP